MRALDEMPGRACNGVDGVDQRIYRRHIVLTRPENCLDNEEHRVRECPIFASPLTDGTLTFLTSSLAAY